MPPDDSRLAGMGRELIALSPRRRVQQMLRWLWSGEMRQAFRNTDAAEIARRTHGDAGTALDWQGTWNDPRRYDPQNPIDAGAYRALLTRWTAGTLPPPLDPVANVKGKIFVAETMGEELGRILSLTLSLRLYRGGTGRLFCDDEAVALFLAPSWDDGRAAAQAFLQSLFAPAGGLPFDIGYRVGGEAVFCPLNGLGGPSASVSLVWHTERLLAAARDRGETMPILPTSWEPRWRGWQQFQNEAEAVSWSGEITASGKLQAVGYGFEKRENAFELNQTVFVLPQEQLTKEPRLADPTDTESLIRVSVFADDYDAAADAVLEKLRLIYWTYHAQDSQLENSEFRPAPPLSTKPDVSARKQRIAAGEKNVRYNINMGEGRRGMLEGWYDEALSCFKAAARATPTAECLNDLCQCCLLAGRDREAYEYAVLGDATATPNPTLRISRRLNHGFALYRLARHTEAMAIYETALREMGESPVPISRALRAILLYRRGLAQRAYAEWLGAPDETAAQAGARRREGLETAIASYRDALDVWRSVQAREVEGTFPGDARKSDRAVLEAARVQTAWGTALRWLRRDDAANSMLADARKARERIWGAESSHPDLLQSRLHIANFVVFRKNTDSAAMAVAWEDLRFVRAALEALPATPYAKLAQTQNAQGNWHHVRYQNGKNAPDFPAAYQTDFEGALRFYIESEANFRKAYGATHQWILDMTENIAELYGDAGDTVNAARFARRADQIRRRVKAENAPLPT